jgi:hypothetical protein
VDPKSAGGATGSRACSSFFGDAGRFSELRREGDGALVVHKSLLSASGFRGLAG